MRTLTSAASLTPQATQSTHAAMGRARSTPSGYSSEHMPTANRCTDRPRSPGTVPNRAPRRCASTSGRATGLPSGYCRTARGQRSFAGGTSKRSDSTARPDGALPPSQERRRLRTMPAQPPPTGPRSGQWKHTTSGPSQPPWASISSPCERETRPGSGGRASSTRAQSARSAHGWCWLGCGPRPNVESWARPRRASGAGCTPAPAHGTHRRTSRSQSSCRTASATTTMASHPANRCRGKRHRG